MLRQCFVQFCFVFKQTEVGTYRESYSTDTFMNLVHTSELHFVSISEELYS